MDAKTFYEQLAPELDPGGFKLYFTAQRLTGFELYKQFPYYGNNMDALWDCLHCSFEFPTTIVLKNIEKIPSEMREAVEIMLELFRDLEERDEEVTVVVEAETKIENISDYII